MKKTILTVKKDLYINFTTIGIDRAMNSFNTAKKKTVAYIQMAKEELLTVSAYSVHITKQNFCKCT